jgi:dihydroxyacetone kinase
VADAQAFVAAAAGSIAQRGKTQLGDKTIYDGLAAVADALADAPDTDAAIEASVAAAADAVERTKDLQSRRGRASWLQERSIGIADPGATALLRFAESWRTAAS